MEKQTEQLNTQLNAEETTKEHYGELIEREKIEGSPFTLIKAEGYGWFIVLGDSRMSDPKPTKEEALKNMQTNMWNLVAMVAIKIASELMHTNDIIKQTPNVHKPKGENTRE